MSFEILSVIFLVVAICIIVPIVLFREGVISTKDCQIFLKTRQLPEWKNLGKTRMVVEKKVGNYYKLVEQGLYINLNDKNGQLEWLINYREGFGTIVPRITSTKLVAKDSVTIDEEGVAHYVTTKDPIEEI